MKAGKVWGTTELIEANGALEFHRIQMNKGGVCSKHLHEFKWNGFYVEKGVMKVRVWQNDYPLCDETILYEGDYTKVKPGLYHQFECLESGVAYELYWAEFNHNDIKRETVGHAGEYQFDETSWDVDHPSWDDTPTETVLVDTVEGDITYGEQPSILDIDWDNATVDGKL